MKRFLDIVFSFFGLLLLSPFLLSIAFLVMLDSKGPVFYRQLRVGKNSIDFGLLKFRTMRIGADKLGLLTVGNRDPRITKVGYVLRKYKLDEFPQLWNVLIGEMSMIGPRPEVRKYVNLYNSNQKIVLSVKPGITDWASIKYRNESEVLSNADDPEKAYVEVVMPEKLKLNLLFINQPTVFNYFRILFSTFLSILK